MYFIYPIWTVRDFGFQPNLSDTDDLESDYCRVSDDELSTFCNFDPFPSPCKCVNNCQATGTGTGTGNRESRIETVPVLTVKCPGPPPTTPNF